MKQIAIIFASRYGQTEKICEFMAARLRAQGHQVQLIEVSAQDPEPILDPRTDVVIVGTPVYMGHFSRPLMNWVQDNSELWFRRTTAYFTVSLNAADQRQQARIVDKEILRTMIQKTSFSPQFTASFSGALMYRKYPWYLRWIMKKISSKAGGPTETSMNHELTDWNQVENFLDDVVLVRHESAFSSSLPLKSKLGWNNTAVTQSLFALAFLLVAHSSWAVEKAKPWNKTMTELLQVLVDLTPSLYSDKPEDQVAFRQNLKKAAMLTQQMDQTQAHPGSLAPDTDPGLASLSHFFREDMDRAVKSADAGQLEYSKSIAKSSISYCVACHTRSVGGPQSPTLGAFEKSLQLIPWTERVNFFAATRQFDEAMKEVIKKLESPLKDTNPIEVEKAVRTGLMVAVRSKESPELALSLVHSVQKSASVSDYLKESAKIWQQDLLDWQKSLKNEKLDSDQKLLDATLKVVGGKDEGARTGRDEIKYLRASTLMHTLLRKYPQSPLRGDALYWIGSSYDVLGDPGFWNLGEQYFLSCIRQNPHTALSERCYKRYEESVVLGYTGSSGVHVPGVVRDHLKSVKERATRKK